MKRIATVLVIVVVFLAGLFAYGLVSLYNDGQAAQDPVLRLVREMVISATPAIMPDPVTIVREVNQIARLETASFIGEKVIVAEKNTDTLFGLFEESIVFIAYGEVIAGVDLEKIRPEDIQVINPTTVQVHLPDPEILVVALDNERSSVVDRDQGLLVGFTGVDPQLESQVRREGEKALEEAALEFGLLREAEENARAYLSNLLEQLGFVTIEFTEDTPKPADPYIQEIPKGYELTTPTP